MHANEITKLLGINRDRIKYFRKQEVFASENLPVGNKSPEYTPEDVQKLKTLIILTKAGLSCGDIRKIQKNEWTLEEALTARRKLLQAELQRIHGSLYLISELQANNSDYTDLDTDFYWNLIQQKEADGLDFIDVETMYGAEKVEELTGMKPVQMQLYVDDGLIHPVKAARAHAAQNSFTENEMEQMKAVAVLRRYLGIAEIKRLQAYPEQTQQLLLEMSEKNGVYLAENEEVLAAIQKLQSLIRDSAELEKLRKETRHTPIPKAASILISLGILVIIGWDVILGSIEQPRVGMVVLLTVSILFAVISGIMAIRYGTAVRRGQKAAHHGIGTVLQVKEVAGFPVGFTRAGNSGSSFSEQGRGGLWVFFFLFWYQLRPDRWFPIIRFEDENGIQALATFCYGGRQRDFQEGEQIPIAWNAYQKTGLLPCSGNWTGWKARFFAMTALFLGCIAALLGCFL